MKRGVNRRATIWAWEQSLPPPSKLLLLALAASASGPDHQVNLAATVTVTVLSERTGLARRTVHTHLRRLEASHHLVAEERVNATGMRLANRWHLNVDGLGPVPLSIATAWKDDTCTSRHPNPPESPPAPASMSTPPELPGVSETPEQATS